MPDYIFNLDDLPAGEYKATIVILADGRKEIAVVTKTQPDFKIPLIQVPFVISHRPLRELPEHGDLILREQAFRMMLDRGYQKEAAGVILEVPPVIPSNKEETE